jgi:hypothetical protein
MYMICNDPEKGHDGLPCEDIRRVAKGWMEHLF